MRHSLFDYGAYSFPLLLLLFLACFILNRNEVHFLNRGHEICHDSQMQVPQLQWLLLFYVWKICTCTITIQAFSECPNYVTHMSVCMLSAIFHNRIAFKSHNLYSICVCVLALEKENGTENNVLELLHSVQREIFNKIKWNMIMRWWFVLSNATHHDFSSVHYKSIFSKLIIKKKLIKGPLAIWEFYIRRFLSIYVPLFRRLRKRRWKMRFEWHRIMVKIFHFSALWQTVRVCVF